MKSKSKVERQGKGVLIKTLIFIMAVLSLIFDYLGCQRVSEVIHRDPDARVDENVEISIGVVLPLTGHLASVGKVMKQGMDLAVNEINTGSLRHGRLKFIIADDTSTAAGARRMISRWLHPACFANLILSNSKRLSLITPMGIAVRPG